MKFESVLRSLASPLRPPTRTDESEMNSDARTLPACQVGISHQQKVLGCRAGARDLNTAAHAGSGEGISQSDRSPKAISGLILHGNNLNL